MTEEHQSVEDEKWDRVKSYYERCYKDFRFKGRPSDETVTFLYKEMLKLSQSIERHFHDSRRHLERLVDS